MNKSSLNQLPHSQVLYLANNVKLLEHELPMNYLFVGFLPNKKDGNCFYKFLSTDGYEQHLTGILLSPTTDVIKNTDILSFFHFHSYTLNNRQNDKTDNEANRKRSLF